MTKPAVLGKFIDPEWASQEINRLNAEIERLRAALTEISDPLMLDIPGSVFGIERALKIINRMRDIAKKALGIALGADAALGDEQKAGET